MTWNSVAARLSAGMLALAALGACGDDPDREPGPSNDPYAAHRQACVDRINDFRATEGKPPYDRWSQIEICSDDEARQDAETGTAHGAFPQCGESAQNECPGWSSIDQVIQGCLQAMWAEGPGEPFSEHGHYLNMSSDQYTRVACGFHETDTGSVWAVQNFGR